ncbi:MAG TPA: dihydrofolate reductase family protein, partial [Flavisolibacter sp.]
KDMTLLGSGSILTQLANEGLLDELRVMIDPVALGKGTSIFNGLDRHVQLTLTGSRVFSSGVILLNYDVKA